MGDILGRYPVNSVSDIDAAYDYFVEHRHKFDPDNRRIYADQLAGHMKTAGYEIPDIVSTYLGGPRDDISAGIHIRRVNSREEMHGRLDAIEKLAKYEHPSDVMEMLDKWDRDAGLHLRYHMIPDAVQTVYGIDKQADFDESSWTGDTDSLQRGDLEAWVNSTDFGETMKKQFPLDLVNSMRQPGSAWAIFSSLPDPHKKIIARMCNDTSSSLRNTHQSSQYVGGAYEREALHQPADRRLEELEYSMMDKRNRILKSLNRGAEKRAEHMQGPKGGRSSKRRI